MFESAFIFQCLHELIRYTAILPILIPHLAVGDVEIGSYFIPKGTQVFSEKLIAE